MDIELKSLFCEIKLIDVLFKYYFDIVDFIGIPNEYGQNADLERLIHVSGSLNEAILVNSHIMGKYIILYVKRNEYCLLDECSDCDDGLRCENDREITYEIKIGCNGNIEFIKNWIENDVCNFLKICMYVINVYKIKDSIDSIKKSMLELPNHEKSLIYYMNCIYGLV